jgi:hypothetical protein
MKGWIAAGAVAAGAVAARRVLKHLPEPYPSPGPTGPWQSQAMPDLPEPVAAYLRTVAPDLPVMTSAVAIGRFTMRLGGVAVPGRWRFTHDVGLGYRHEMDIVVMGRRVAGGDERFVDGHARLDLPGGVVEGPTVDSAALLSMWAEYLWLPSVLATATWEPIDAVSARMLVPGGEQPLLAWFDPETHLLTRFETQRWRDAGDPGPRPWSTGNLAWTRINGIGVPAVGAVQWGDQRQPWLRLSLDDVAWNLPVTL